MSHYTILRDKKHGGRFFSMYHSHFTDVLVTDRRFSHGPITVPLNVAHHLDWIRPENQQRCSQGPEQRLHICLIHKANTHLTLCSPFVVCT